MGDDESYARLSALATACGAETRDLTLGPWIVRLAGLDHGQARELAERWGPFLAIAGAEPPTASLVLVDAGPRPWLPAEGPGALYRLEATGPPGRRAIVSRHFALGADPEQRERFKLGLVRGPEPDGRMVENAVRFVAANLALDAGGFAMHAAGVLHDGRAFLYAGPSRAGKTTAVAASAPARSLGDDYALVFRAGDGWVTPAVPFDGAERIEPSAVMGAYPVGAIWRLYQADAVRVARPSSRVAAASLLSCAAFPWTYPERAGELLHHVQRFVATAEFAHLQFDRDADLFSTLLAPS